MAEEHLIIPALDPQGRAHDLPVDQAARIVSEYTGADVDEVEGVLRSGQSVSLDNGWLIGHAALADAGYDEAVLWLRDLRNLQFQGLSFDEALAEANRRDNERRHGQPGGGSDPEAGASTLGVGLLVFVCSLLALLAQHLASFVQGGLGS
jgi:hypothetical protein